MTLCLVVLAWFDGERPSDVLHIVSQDGSSIYCSHPEINQQWAQQIPI